MTGCLGQQWASMQPILYVLAGNKSQNSSSEGGRCSPIFKVGALFGPPLHLLLILIFLILIQLSYSSTGSEFDATGDHHSIQALPLNFFAQSEFGSFAGLSRFCQVLTKEEFLQHIEQPKVSQC